MSDLTERLNRIWMDDHDRGCQGREYSCTCGFDEEAWKVAKEAAGEIGRLRGAMEADDERLRLAAERVGIHAGCDAPEMMADEIERLTLKLDAHEADAEAHKARIDRIKAYEDETRDLKAEIDRLNAQLAEARDAALEDAAKHLDDKAAGYEAEAQDVRGSSDDRRLSGAVAVRFRGSAAAIRALKGKT